MEESRKILHAQYCFNILKNLLSSKNILVGKKYQAVVKNKEWIGLVRNK